MEKTKTPSGKNPLRLQKTIQNLNEKCNFNENNLSVDSLSNS